MGSNDRTGSRGARIVTRMRLLRRLLPVARIALLIASLGVANGCSDMGVPPPIVVYNRSGVAIRVFADLHSGVPFEVTSSGAAAPDTNAAVRSDIFPGSACSSRGDLVIRDAAGNELGRTSGPICPGDDWLVDARGVRRSEPPAPSS
jgi:hypothetical protein